MQEHFAVDFNAMYYAPVGTALPDVCSTADFVAAGWILFNDADGNEGSIWTVDTLKKERRYPGSRMPAGAAIIKSGLETLSFRSYRSDLGALYLALPDGQYAGADHLMAGKHEQEYRSIAMPTDNSVYWARKVAATGKVPLTFKNDDWTYTPYEFDCYERSELDPAGTTNWDIFAITS